MPSDLDPALLARAVTWGGLLLGLVLGAVGQATRFCVRGAIADWVTQRQPGRLLAWLVAIATGALAVQALLAAGLFDATRTVQWQPRFPWASYLVGGLVFGYGMILAGGCPQRCLVKLGQGNAKAALVLLLVAVAATMTLRGAFAPLRVQVLDGIGPTLAGPQDLGSLLGPAVGLAAASTRWLLAAALALGVGLLAWRGRARLTTGQWLGGAVVGLLVAVAFWLTGHLGFLAEHPETLEPAWLGTQGRRPEALSFSAPMAHALDLLTLWTDRNTVLTFGVTLSLGTLLGAFTTARLRGDFQLEAFRSPRELGEHAAGAVLMGFGGITALGCSVGNGVTGLALLSTGALLAVAGIVAGAWLALQRQQRRAVAGGQPLPAAKC